MSRALTLFDDRVGLWAAVGVVVALLAFRPLARRFACGPAVLLLAVLSAEFVVLMTVANRGVDVSSDGLGDQLLWWTRGAEAPRGPDVLGWAFNAVLFVPVAFFTALLSRRPWLVAGVLVAVSMLVETAQATVLTGRPDQFDVLANSAGAIIGAALGRFVMAHQPPRPPSIGANSTP